MDFRLLGGRFGEELAQSPFEAGSRWQQRFRLNAKHMCQTQQFVIGHAPNLCFDLRQGRSADVPALETNASTQLVLGQTQLETELPNSWSDDVLPGFHARTGRGCQVRRFVMLRFHSRFSLRARTRREDSSSRGDFTLPQQARATRTSILCVRPIPRRMRIRNTMTFPTSRTKSCLLISRDALRIVCGLTLAVAIPLASAPDLCSAAESPPVNAAAESPLVKIQAFFDGKPPQDEIDHLFAQARSRSLSPWENLNLALAHFAIRDFGSSLAIARTLAGSFPQGAEESIRVHLLIAENLGALGKFPEAAEAASEAQKLHPDSTSLAALRVGFYTKAGDPVNRLIAEDHLRMLAPEFQQKPVLFGIDDTIIIVGIAVYGAIVCFAERQTVELVNQMILDALETILGRVGSVHHRP